MTRIQFPHESSGLIACFRVRQPPNAPSDLSCPSAAPRLRCGYRLQGIFLVWLGACCACAASCILDSLSARRIGAHRVQIRHVRFSLDGEYDLNLLYLQLPSKCHHYIVQQFRPHAFPYQTEVLCHLAEREQLLYPAQFALLES